MSWQTQLEAIGIDDSNMPNMIRKAIKDLYSFQSTKEKIEGYRKKFLLLIKSVVDESETISE